MQLKLLKPGRSRPALLAAGIITALIAVGGAKLYASDHQDTPLVELNPAMDMTDVYAFPGSGPDRVALVLNRRVTPN